MQDYLWMQRRHRWNFPSAKMDMFYFVLKEDRLYYVENKEDLIDSKSTNEIVLTPDTDIKRHDKNKEYIFLQIKAEKYTLKMENEEECTKWHDAITKALKSYKSTKTKENVSRCFFHWLSVFGKKKTN